MSQFPRNARAGQTHRKFGRKYVYSETTETWSPIVPLASAAEARRTAAVASSATTFYATAAELPLSDNTTGTLAFVSETNRLYVWSGTGWYNIATISAAGASISGANATYTLATDGTPTVVTLTQSGLTSPTWSYEVTSGSIGRTAIVTQVDNVFTITPSTLARNVGSFGITFKATDGSNTIVKTSQFSMSNTAPVISTAPNATYTLASDGTPTVITLAATDADGHAITWSYEVVSGSLGGTTISIDGSEFTITPSTDTGDAGTFQLRFIASDGASFDADVAEFELGFGPVLTQTIENPDPYISGTGGDFFARSININGDKVLVGAPWEDDAGGDLSGKAYVFNVTNGSLLYTLNNPNSYGTSTQDFFGDEQCVAINSTRYWVSSWYNQASDGVTRAGTVYGFNLTGSLTNTINAPSGIGTFGKVIAASDNYLVIGAPDNNDPSFSQTGKAFIYNSSGSLLYTLTNPSIYNTTYDTFGFSVDVDGNYVIVSSPGSKKDANLAYLGRVYIYNATTGTLVKTLDNPNPETSSGFDQFGYKVRLTGNYAIVTSFTEDVGFANSGIAYVYKTTNGTWSDATLLYTIYNPTASNPTPEGAFGQHLDINSDTIFVTTGTKTLWAFNLIDGSLKYDLKLPAEVIINSVSATDSRIAMGSISPGSTVGKGQAYIYQL